MVKCFKEARGPPVGDLFSESLAPFRRWAPLAQRHAVKGSLTFRVFVSILLLLFCQNKAVLIAYNTEFDMS